MGVTQLMPAQGIEAYTGLEIIKKQQVRTGFERDVQAHAGIMPVGGQQDRLTGKV